MKQKRWNAGFSLVELMLAVAILATLCAFGFVSVAQYVVVLDFWHFVNSICRQRLAPRFFGDGVGQTAGGFGGSFALGVNVARGGA